MNYHKIDDIMMDSVKGKKIKPGVYLTPVNGEEQKRLFFKGGYNKNPDFKYRKLEYNPEEIGKKLKSIHLSEGWLKDVYEDKIKELLVKNELIANRENKELVKEKSSDIYGFPRNKERARMISYSKHILENLPNIVYEKNVPASEIKKSLESGLSNISMDDWDVEYSDKRLTTVHPADKKITVCENRVFGEIDGTKQKNHEFSVHGLRAINGCCQDFGVFQIGFPDYLATEEGLAVYAEKIMGSTNGELERDYAGRALAVDSVFNGDGFKQTFDMLKTYDMTDDQAWGLALRAHRFIKDHVYVDGFLRISRFVEDDENLEMLYVGKIGIDDLELIRKLLDKDIVKSPPYLPGFIDLL